MKHVWTLWGMLLGKLRPALAERRRRGVLVNAGVPPPARAGPREESGLGCEQIGISGWESRTESPCAVGAANRQLGLFV